MWLKAILKESCGNLKVFFLTEMRNKKQVNYKVEHDLP